MPLDIVQSVQKTFEKYDWTPSEFQKEGAGNIRYLKDEKNLRVWQSYWDDIRGIAIETDKERLVISRAAYLVKGKREPSYSIVVVPLDKDGFYYRGVIVAGKKQKQGQEGYVHRFVHKHPEFPVVLCKHPSTPIMVQKIKDIKCK